MSRQADCMGKNWVVIVAGSTGWNNYRHQADACHAYQIVHRNGIPDEQIVVMMYDDIAYNTLNPTQGIIINRPNGPDVYKGVPKDYTGDAVTPANFLAVLKGDSQGSSGKVLNSGPNDHVFVYFADHGASGILAFPDDELHVEDFMDTIKYMHASERQYNTMVIYIEACFSGSMLTGLPADVDVYATTAANDQESSYACYWDEKRGTCLGDLYSVTWMENSDAVDMTKESLFQQFEFVKESINASHVQQFGDKTVSHMKLMEFQGNSFAGAQPAEPMTLQPVERTDIIRSCDVPLAILKRRLMASDDMSTMRGLLMEIDTHLKVRDKLKETMRRMVERVARGDKPAVEKILSDRMELSQHECYKSAVTHYKHNCFNWNEMEYEYALTHLHVLVNLCEAGYSIGRIREAIDHVVKKY